MRKKGEEGKKKGKCNVWRETAVKRKNEREKEETSTWNEFFSLQWKKSRIEGEGEGDRVRDGFFARVDAARDVGQRHVAGVMRRDTLVGGRSSSSSSLSLSLSVEEREERVGSRPPSSPPRSVIRQVGIHIYRVVKSIGVSVSPCIL